MILQKEDKEIAEEKFKEIAEAYEILSNEGIELRGIVQYIESRAKYDRGEDTSDQANQARANPFQNFNFAFPGGFNFGGFNFGGGQGGGQGFPGGGQGFPGGFNFGGGNQKFEFHFG